MNIFTIWTISSTFAEATSGCPVSGSWGGFVSASSDRRQAVGFLNRDTGLHATKGTSGGMGTQKDKWVERGRERGEGGADGGSSSR